mgnify:CR=1 FL=1|jgi:hypothetical protein
MSAQWMLPLRRRRAREKMPRLHSDQPLDTLVLHRALRWLSRQVALARGSALGAEGYACGGVQP